MPRSVLVLLLIGVAVHLASALFVFVFDPHFISPESDQYGYRVLALNLLDHHSFSMLPPPDNDPMLLRTPGYPAFLAGFYALDRSNFLVIVVQQLMLVASAAMAYFVMRRFDVGRFVALALFALLLLEPMQWLYSLQTMTESLALFLVSAALALSVLPRNETISRSVAVGALIGVLPLVKPNLILFSPLIVFLFLLSFDAPLRRKLVLGGVAVLVALLVLAPWLLRNYALVGAPIVSLSPAVNLIVGLGTHEESALVSTGVPIDGICCRMPYWNASAYPTLVGIEHAIITREGILYLALRQLAYAPRVYFDRAFYVTLAKITDIPADLVAKAIATLQGILLVLLVAGLFSMARTKYFWHACLFFLMIASVLVLNARVSYSRMLIPLYPMFATLAGIALTQIINLFRSKETS